jgi:protein-S-isoprenylcysteine O-methyltransferase Ste14
VGRDSTILSSSRLPKLGPRGEGWVVAQFVLMAATVVAGFARPGWPVAVRALGIAVAIVGAAYFVASARALGRSLTPFPKPRGRAELVERGPYRLVRHPIYGAGMVTFLGYGLATSVPALALAALLAVFWLPKSAVEERWLQARFAAYEDYRRRTPRRFLPWLI